MTEIGGIELANGKCHIVEYLAGIILISGDAFLVGNSVFSSTDKILCGTNDTNDGKDTDRNEKLPFGMVSVAYAALKARNDLFGNIVATAATITARITLVLFNDLRRKYDWVNHFYHSLGDVFGAAAGLGGTAEVITGCTSEDADVTFAAVEDDLLFDYRHALKFL